MTKQELERRQTLWEQGYWEIPEHIDDTGFNYEWRPHPTEPPQFYQFGTQWQRTSGPRFVVPEATNTVYVDDQKVTSLPRPELFSRRRPGDVEFDWSWHPDETEPNFIYVFGNKWTPCSESPIIEYYQPDATEKKYMDYPHATVYSDPQRWTSVIPDATIDRTWVHPLFDPPFIYVFGNKWNNSHTEETMIYTVPGATDKKYITNIIAELPPCLERWTVSNDQDRKTFDFSWRPNPYSPPQTYQWENNGPVYTMPGSTGTVLMRRSLDNDIPIPRYYIETTLEDLIAQHPDQVFWALNHELKYEQFDFGWKPDQENFTHINAFGNEFSKDTGTYYVNAPAWLAGHRDINYIEEVKIAIETDIDMCYVVRGSNPNQYEQLKERFPRLQKTRYMSSWVDTINRAIKKSTTKFMWILCSDLDYTDFEFDYYPSQWNQNYVNVFGTQWSRWGNTYLINTHTFAADTKYINQIEHLTNINHVRTRRAKIADCLYDVVYIDFGNSSSALDVIRKHCGDREVTVISYDTSYYHTLKQWASKLNEYEIRSEHYVWICTSVTDYSEFDFTWVSDPFQREQLHVFSVVNHGIVQQFGDTFLLNLNTFRQECVEFDRLEQYTQEINYISHANKTHRLPHPVIRHNHDSQADAVRAIEDRTFPYTELVSDDSLSAQSVIPNLWDTDTATVVVASTGASRIFVPTVAIDYVHDEVYDYHHIEMATEPDSSRLLDIVFFSNGEPAAQENFEHLLSLNLQNRIIRQSDVAGRVESQHAAANSSATQWYFLINAKLRVNEQFDFTWQPDRLQRAKHYIFMATNPVNGLQYGHQAIVANNRRLTLSTQADGLDFTMSSAHEVVDMNCGVARYNTDPWTTWRTAFREAIKLQYYSENSRLKENTERLNTWLTVGNGENGQWSTGGAYDAVEYYKSVDGQLPELMRSYEWRWLREYYDGRYGK